MAAQLTASQKKSLNALAETFGDRPFSFDFRFQYAHGLDGSSAVIPVSAKSFQALLVAGAVTISGLGIYSLAGSACQSAQHDGVS